MESSAAAASNNTPTFIPKGYERFYQFFSPFVRLFKSKPVAFATPDPNTDPTLTYSGTTLPQQNYRKKTWLQHFFPTLFPMRENIYATDINIKTEEEEGGSFLITLFWCVVIAGVIAIFISLIVMLVNATSKLQDEREKNKKLKKRPGPTPPSPAPSPGPSEISVDMVQTSIDEALALNSTFNRLVDNASVDVRSSYYEMQETEVVHRWTRSLFVMYVIVLSVLGLVVFMKKGLTWTQRLTLFFFILLFTNMYVIKFVVLLFVFVYRWIVEAAPKNIFLQLT